MIVCSAYFSCVCCVLRYLNTTTNPGLMQLKTLDFSGILGPKQVKRRGF